MAALLCRGAAARAQSALSTEDATVRRVLLDQARAAQQEGDHARAHTLAARAGAMQMTPSVRLFLAEEEQALGRSDAAVETAETCVREAERDMALRNREFILQRCHRVAEEARERSAPRVAATTTHAEVPARSSARGAVPAVYRGPGIAPWIVAGAGGLVLIGGGVAWAERGAPYVRGNALVITADIAFGVGSAMVVGGVAWFVVGTVLANRANDPLHRTPTAFVIPTGDGALIGVSGTL